MAKKSNELADEATRITQLVLEFVRSETKSPRAGILGLLSAAAVVAVAQGYDEDGFNKMLLHTAGLADELRANKDDLFRF